MIEGLWLVTRVAAGDQEMTPIGKWAKFNSDGSQESGNGWLKHSIGTWAYDEGSNSLNIVTTNERKDPAGAFTVQHIDNSTMVWERMEEGMLINVQLEKIEELPAVPADQAHGVWDLKKVQKAGNDITAQYDKEGLAYLFIQWDRRYLMQDDEGKQHRGFWWVHPHRPMLELVSHEEGVPRRRWNMSFSENEMKLEGISDENKSLVLTYERIDYFPEGK